ncbi:AAA family ATPase [Arcobacter aquimarinus]|uniref:ATPase AAA-type core domain-containing protein n=1 Tax=Arcobacter aquimarinus TaxID=1315211 RepID=A0AAE7E115_9BACT|nr:AAA family ATPase [Arcobacter aquimarinus]QKE26618.1 hypothetical protein AAQM_1882 [Arcobacter aquimarinus]RXI36560.1 hypothetical protein CP986_01635 [Arcobacter aquimarinus]
MKIYFCSDKIDVFDDNSIYLFQDHIYDRHSKPWDDYGYTIMFQAYIKKNDELKNLGFLRILTKEYTDTSKYFLEKAQKLNDEIYDISNILKPENTISIGFTIDYYHKLNKLFAKQSRDVLKSICDASYNYNKYQIYSKWNGFNVALMRGKSSDSLLVKGYKTALGEYSIPDEFNINLTSLNNIEDTDFYFNNVNELSKININVLVGNNGVGKTTILQEIIDIVSGVKDIKEKWPYFNKLITVAFSPFEKFYTKEQLIKELDNKNIEDQNIQIKNEKEKTRKRKRKLKTEYAYIGFRNEDNVFDLNFPKSNIILSIIKIFEYDLENSWWQEKNRLKILFDTLSLSITFDAIKFKKKNGDYLLLSKNNVTDFQKEEIDLKEEIKFCILKENKDEEITLSSGQMIYSYMLPAIISELEDESLIIIDEPELYLHPTIEVGLISMLNYLLDVTSSYAIVATHSSIIVREVNRRGIKVLRRSADKYTEVNNPSVETYGESIDIITGEIFDDFYTDKPYQKKITNYISKDFDKNIEKIKSEIGDDALAFAFSKKSTNKSLVFKEDV